MATNVSALLALEIQRVLEDFAERQALLVRLWSMHRDRAPMANIAFSRWKTLRTDQLDQLRPEVVVGVDAFYLALEEWLAYVATTEDMPLHLEHAWEVRRAILEETAEVALDLLGAAPSAPTPDADSDGRTFLEAFALKRPSAGTLSERSTLPAPTLEE